MKFLLQNLPQVSAGAIAVFFGILMLPPHDADGDWHYHDFGRLPVLEDGRYKPLDSVARNSLMILTQRQGFYYYDEETKEKTYVTANRWMLDVMASHRVKDNPVWDYRVFRIDHDELVNSHLKLPWREGLRYSMNELRPSLENIAKQAELAEETPAKNRTLIQVKYLELANHMGRVQRIAQLRFPAVIPNEPGRGWYSIMDAVNAYPTGEAPNPETIQTLDVYARLIASYSKGDKAGFNDVLTRHLNRLEKESPGLMRSVNLEVFLNDFAPFLWCWWAYVLVAIIGAASWFPTAWSAQLQRAGAWSMFTVFVVHTAAIIIRMYLQGKPPVTNLYSSAIFIGWACAGVCLIVENWCFRYSIATVVGSMSAFATLIIAHFLSLDGETMPMLVAVLDTNFWLSTHVTCITLGYMTTIVAGFMGVAYIFLGMFTGKLRGKWATDLTSMTYGVLCTGMFLSFVGTVLGGLWADYSWGRFWGWDPKENGALLIVIWIALILHARWGGMIKQRGIAVLSVLGMIVTGWSYFGTNFLGIGKHAYGGSQGKAMIALVVIDFVILGIAGLGLFPLEMWKSFAPSMTTPPPPSTPQPPGSMAAKPV